MEKIGYEEIYTRNDDVYAHSILHQDETSVEKPDVYTPNQYEENGGLRKDEVYQPEQFGHHEQRVPFRVIDLIAAFELEINKLDDSLQKPVTDDSLYWINQAVVKFVKDRFNGNAPKRTSYEQNEKRTRDLIHLLREVKTEQFLEDKSHVNYDSYEYIYPLDMMYVLNEDVQISDNNGDYKMDTCVFECTADNFMYRVNNSLTDFHYRYHRARPLRVRTRNGFRLLTDKKYKIDSYTLGYLKTPKEITSENWESVCSDFEEYTWLEILKIAAQMYVENQSDPRYKTLTNEVLTQE